jgi:DNA polymerase-3 subunit delta'
LEEPWENTVFILISEHPEALLDTIISRCQSVNVGRIEQDALRSYATRSLGATEEQADVVAKLADGSLLTLRRVVAEGSDGSATDNFELFTRLMRLSYSNKHLDLFEWAEQVAAMGRENQKSFLEYSLRLIRESYMLTAGMESVSYLWGDEKAFCSKFAPFVANHNVEAIVAEIERALRDVGQNGNAKIVFTHFALAMSKLIAMRG